MKNYKLYVVGGFVRDKLLGVKSNDVDYAFEFSEEYVNTSKHFIPLQAYEDMNVILKNEGYEIFLETPKAFTTRAKFPIGHQNQGLVADFVLCRKEVYLDPNSRSPTVQIGTLYDDLLRRDFTVNAIAIDEEGNLIDPFNGQKDLKEKILKCPTDAITSFMDDPLRAIRCLRFAVTKGFDISDDCRYALQNEPMWEKFDKVVSRQRVQQELKKMFIFNVVDSMTIILDEVEPHIVKDIIFKEDIWLKPTDEKK